MKFLDHNILLLNSFFDQVNQAHLFIPPPIVLIIKNISYKSYSLKNCHHNNNNSNNMYDVLMY